MAGWGHRGILGALALLGALLTLMVSASPAAAEVACVGDSYELDEDVSLVVPEPGVLGNDIGVTQAIHDPSINTLTSGALELNLDGSFTYTPPPHYSGRASFSYLASDDGSYVAGNGHSCIAVVELLIHAVNDPPMAVNDQYEGQQNGVVYGNLWQNDFDDGGPQPNPSLEIVTAPAHGTLEFPWGDGNFRYYPEFDFVGTDTFTYRNFDGELYSEPATVTITIVEFNQPPVARQDFYTAEVGTTLEVAAPGVLANDADPDRTPLTAVLVEELLVCGTLALNSDGSFSMTVPDDPNCVGPEQFVYQAFDGVNYSDRMLATVNFTDATANTAPVAEAGSYTTAQGTPVSITLGATDIDNDSLTYTVTSDPANGGLSGTAPSLTYTPNSAFSGTDSFTFVANDGQADSAEATVTITVEPAEPTYSICPLYDASKPAKAGSVKPIKLQLCGADGSNLSDPAVPLNVVGLVKIGDTVSGVAEDAGNANPDSTFRYDAALGGYIFNLDTSGLAAGTWQVQFTVNGGGEVYGVEFSVK